MEETLISLADRTREIYDRNAARFDAERSKRLHERVWLDRFTDGLPAGGRILDLGCGAGEPIAAHFIDAGYRVTGFDFSQEMIRIARTRWPEGDWRIGDMRSMDLTERFDGVIGWNSFFHLTREDQPGVLARIAAQLCPGGRLMLTVGPANGEVTGRVGDDTVYHASLAPEEYRAILADHGVAVLAFVAEDPECDLQTVLLAENTGP